MSAVAGADFSFRVVFDKPGIAAYRKTMPVHKVLYCIDDEPST
jgi:hypothetical protein